MRSSPAPAETKTFDRPEVVHQLKEVKGKFRTTKCGLFGDDLLTTAWHSEITCSECNP